MSIRVGKKCKVTLGANTVMQMGSWSYNGITSDQFDASVFGDNWKKYKFGMKDGGNIVVGGFYDPDDTTGQEELQQANIENTDITTVRLYVDNTSYLEPCQTTGYFSPSTTTGNDTELSHVNVTSYDINSDKSGLMGINFGMKVSGVMVLV